MSCIPEAGTRPAHADQASCQLGKDESRISPIVAFAAMGSYRIQDAPGLLPGKTVAQVPGIALMPTQSPGILAQADHFPDEIHLPNLHRNPSIFPCR